MELTLPLLLITVIATIAAWRGLRANPEAGHGRWSTIALTCGLLWGFFLLAASSRYSGHGRESSKWVACISNMKQHSLALQMYASDSDGRLPKDEWWVAINDYIPDDLGGCPSARPKYKAGTGWIDYGINDFVRGGNPEKFDPLTMLLGERRIGTRESVVSSESDLLVRHRYRINFTLVDGSAKSHTSAIPHTVLWEPDRKVEMEKIGLAGDPDRFRGYRQKVDDANLTVLLFAWPIVLVGSIIGAFWAPPRRREFWRIVMVCLIFFAVLMFVLTPIY